MGMLRPLLLCVHVLRVNILSTMRLCFKIEIGKSNNLGWLPVQEVRSSTDAQQSDADKDRYTAFVRQYQAQLAQAQAASLAKAEATKDEEVKEEVEAGGGAAYKEEEAGAVLQKALAVFHTGCTSVLHWQRMLRAADHCDCS